MILIIALSTFVCISLGMLGVYWLLYKPQSAATERLRRMTASSGGKAEVIQSAVTPEDSANSEAALSSGVAALSAVTPEDSAASELAQRLASPLNKLLPPSATEAKKLQKQLM